MELAQILITVSIGSILLILGVLYLDNLTRKKRKDQTSEEIDISKAEQPELIKIHQSEPIKEIKPEPFEDLSVEYFNLNVEIENIEEEKNVNETFVPKIKKRTSKKSKK